MGWNSVKGGIDIGCVEDPNGVRSGIIHDLSCGVLCDGEVEDV